MFASIINLGRPNTDRSRTMIKGEPSKAKGADALYRPRVTVISQEGRVADAPLPARPTDALEAQVMDENRAYHGKLIRQIISSMTRDRR